MQAPKQDVLTVSELTLSIKQQLEGRFTSIAVQGEVSNLKCQDSGHLYFTLKDADAQISAVLFKGNARTLSKMPKNGDQVIVKGEINVYPQRGSYQIIVRELSLAGVGALLLKLHEMKLKLQERGWFDKSRRKPLPKYPKTIGVVTSGTGSVIQDILHILERRHTHFHLILNPVKVQGDGAAEEIARAIEQFNEHGLADVLIVGRGGGSLEDLWAFNEERVASAIFHSRIPIICAVGHETDYCIADFVADVRAPTPSAAAEIVSAERAMQVQFLKEAKSRLGNHVLTRVQHSKKQLEHYRRHPYLSSPYLFLAPHIQRLDDFSEELKRCTQRYFAENGLKLAILHKQIRSQNPKSQIATGREKMLAFEITLQSLLKGQIAAKCSLASPESWRKKIDQLLYKMIAEKKERLAQLIAHLKGIDPKNLLTKGYCLLFHENNLIHSVHELKMLREVRLMLHDGEAQLYTNSSKPL